MARVVTRPSSTAAASGRPRAAGKSRSFSAGPRIRSMNRRAGLALGWAWVAAIVYLSLMPSPPKVDLEGGDKLGHFFASAVLAYWFCQFYFRRTRLAYLLAFVAMGVAIEFVQRATGYRSFELADMAANAVGVAAGWGAALLVPLRRPNA